MGIPVLGIGYGSQLMSHYLVGKIAEAKGRGIRQDSISV